MKTFIIENEEKERIKFLYESKGVILSEESIWGSIVRAAKKLAGQSEDDLIRAFKTTEVALAKSLDDIVSNAMKSKNIAELDDLQAKLMHTYNPSDAVEGIQEAKNLVIKFLNGYSKSKGKSNWKAIRDEVSGTTPTSSGPKASGPTSSAGFANNLMSGQRVSNRWYAWKPEYIDFTKFSNPQTTFDELNKNIAKAIKTGQWNMVPRAGFEKLGITNFREFLQNNIAKVNEIDPSIGRWSVTFK